VTGLAAVARGLAANVATAALQPDRRTAQSLAERELLRPEYHTDEPNPVQRLISWLLDQLDRVRAPAGFDGRLLLLLVTAVVLAVVGYTLWRTGGVRRQARADVPDLLGDRPRTAAEHRAAAEAAEAAEDLRTAVLERFRAVVRACADRSLVELVPGRTADEAARSAGAWLTDVAGDLITGAAVFDDVRYGDRQATPEHVRFLKDLDERAAATRPQPLTQTGLAVPG
jgi:Domain of unknown function (DUF4129)